MKPNIVWAAGLFEGEGCIATHACRQWQLAVTSTDQDTIQTLHRIMGCGTVLMLKRLPKRKQTWRWRAGARCDVVRCLERMLPYLHSRRRARAVECLAVAKPLQHRKRGQRW